MLRFLKSFFVKPTQPAEPAPYKVETPVVTPIMVPPEPAKCGCGRSASGLCVGLHKLTAEEWSAHPDNPVKPVAEKAPEKKVPAKKAAPKKPAAMKAAAKPKAKAAAKPKATK
jgi:hypothetical protein